MASFEVSTSNAADYGRFLAARRLPRYRVQGRQIWVPDEYAELIGLAAERIAVADYEPSPFLFDYQRDIARMAIAKRRFACFADCGLGKSLILLEFARHAVKATGKPALIVSPLMVVRQTCGEHRLFYPNDDPLEQVRAAGLDRWLASGQGIGITNYDAMHEGLDGSRLGCLILDESSMLKSAYGKWGTACIQLGRDITYKLCCTGTPAPNDRIEYANHSVFLDQARTVNEFYARYFVNRGQTNNRWEMKPHALRPFYRDLSHWCVFLSDPKVYGWKDNCDSIPPIHVNIHDVDLTGEQREIVQQESGTLVVTQPGGIGTRSTYAQLAKGKHRGKSIATNKPAFIRSLADSWPEESTIIWCLYNDEQERMAAEFPEAANISGETPVDERLELVEAFQSGQRRILVSKGKILGFGLNLQIATRQIFSGLQDSYETYYQCVKRSNRIGSTKPLNVHIPVTEVEAPMIETVLRKAKRVEEDTREQERLFREAGSFHA